MATLGIDYGSSNTTVSWINPRHGKPETIKFNGDGSVKYPSVILGYEKGLVFGYQALNYLIEVDKLPPEERIEMLVNFIPSLKRVLDPNGVEFIGDKEYTHMQLLLFFFEQIKQMANAHCGSDVVFDSVIVSHPVDCEEATIRMLKDALLASGFNNVKMQLEPIAAVMGYGIDHDIPEEQGVLVFDFGGGTIDVAYVKKHLDSFRIICEPKGDKSCGGQDIDMLLYENLRKKLIAEFDMDISRGNVVDLGMLNSCRRLKEYFSDSNDVHETSIIFVKDGKINTFKYKLNRESFNNIIYPKVTDAINVAKAVIKQTETKKIKIDKVLLIGGSSQLSLVRQILTEILPEATVDTCGEMDVAVALGNIVEAIKSEAKESNGNSNGQDIPNCKINRNKSILCPACGSNECYHYADKFGYLCLSCGYVRCPKGRPLIASIHIEPKALANTIVAMANADGGMIAVGISDKTRRIEGVDQDKAHLNEILRTPFDFCVPTISVTTEFMPCQDSDGNDNHILIIHVPASPRLHANQADEVFWRVGDKSRKLPFEERLQLMYDKGERYYEDSPAYDATIEDIDMDAVKAYMRRIGYGKSPMEYLQENKGFLTYKGDVPQVSTACILLFGKRPQNFLPRARVRFIKYYGTEEKVGREMNVIKDVTFEGRILDQIQKTIEYLETQVKEHSYLGEDGLFKTDREYPKFVIQEMTVNSVCHRDYSIKGTEIQIKMFDDRLVFETPGKLPGIVRTDNIRHTHFSRNPKIAEYLKAYDYVKEFGEGVDRMCRELSAIGTKEPQYHLVAFIMKATVWANILEEGQENNPIKNQAGQENEADGQEKGKKRARKGQEKILVLIKSNPYISISSIAEVCGMSIKTTRNLIDELREDKLLERIGPAKGGYWKILSEDTED